jgi:acyl carrier protein
MDDEIRRVLAAHGRLSVDVEGLAADANLYNAGLSSHATVNVMLALEDAFDVEFPDAMLRKSTFGSVESLRVALQQLLSDPVSS